MLRILPLINRVLLLALLLLLFGHNFIGMLHLPYNTSVAYGLIGLYLLLVLIELVLNIKSAREGYRTGNSFRYLTRLLVFKKLIINVIVLALAIVTLFVYGVFPELTLFLFVIAGTDIIGSVIRRLSGVYRVMIEEFTFSIVDDQEKVINHGRINEVAFRYEVLFFKLKDGSVKEISVENIEKERQKEFVQAMVKWLEERNIPIEAESMQKLTSWL
jgi:hypothetical protein